LKDSSARQYLQWIRRFRAYCGQRHLDERTELTLKGARRFVTWYARRRHLVAGPWCASARTALFSLNRVYQVLGLDPPNWQTTAAKRSAATPLLRAFAAYLINHRGNPEITVRKKLAHVDKLLSHLRRRALGWRTMQLSDIDRFLIECARCYARTTTADIAGSVRTLLRFLQATGRRDTAFAESVIAPVKRKHERPRKALAWEQVQRLLGVVERSSARGMRDYALLLLMSTYGFGAGEVIRLRLDDIDWRAGTLQVMRPKTGAIFTLPLLPAVAKVLARYVREARPPQTRTRHLFVQMKVPFGALCASSAIRHILIKHGKAAGIEAAYLGSHVLRHTHAARQIDLGARPRVVSDILGHRDPESVSAYVRIATEKLRELSLPVPV
jgi:integrase/recombinase XerD